MAKLFGGKKPASQKGWREKENCTYFCEPEKLKEKQPYVLGFTLEVLQSVCSAGGTEGGWVCNLRHLNHPEDTVFPCFISSSGWQTPAKFLSEIGKTPGMPGVFTMNLDSKILGRFIAWKNDQYARARGMNPDRKPVMHRNMQSDEKTVCFGPDLFFVRKNGEVVPIPAVEADYVWVPSILKSLVPLQIYRGDDRVDVLETILAKLDMDNMSDTFICFLLICELQHVPALVVTGPRHTGKTFGLEVSACYVGVNGIQISVAKDITLSALRDRYTSDHFPLIVHDCKDPGTMATAIHESYEGRDVKKGNDVVLTPGTSVAFSCNEGPMEHLRSKMEALSRAVVIPMTEQMHPMSAEQYEAIKQGKNSASKHFPALVSFTDTEKKAFHGRVFDVRPKVAQAMEGLKECSHRIPENFAILTAATELFLAKTGHASWIHKVEPFVTQKLLPATTKFYAEIQSKSSTLDPVVGLNSHEKASIIQQFCRVASDIRQIQPDKLTECLIVQAKPFVSLKDSEFEKLIAEIGSGFQLASLRKLDGVLFGQATNFSDKTKRATCIPKAHFTYDQLMIVKGEKEFAEAAETHPPVQKRTLGLSPFKSANFLLDSNDIVSNTPPGSPLASSTPKGKPEDGAEKMTAVMPRLPFLQDVAASGNPEELATTTQAIPGTSKSPASHTGRETNPPGSTTKVTNSNAPGNANKKPKISAKPPCSGCVNVVDKAGNSDTHLCFGCKKRYHMACQPQSDKYWPASIKARKRRCEACLVIDALE